MYHVLGQRDRPAIAHAEQVIKKIGHPKYSTSFLSFDKICRVTVCIRKCIFVWKVYFMQSHYLDQTECSSSAHPCFLMKCSHRLKCGNQNPSLNLFSIYRILTVATETQGLQNMFRVLVERLLKVPKLNRKKRSQSPHRILQADPGRFLVAVFGPG